MKSAIIRPLAIAFCLAFACTLPGLAQKPGTMEEMHRLHADSKAYIAALDDPARDAYQKPHEVVQALGLKDGERIADIGAGSGYFALRFARHVGAGGRVVAVDISQDMIRTLDSRARDAGLHNVETVLASPDDPRLADASVDRIFICDTWHHIPAHPAYLERLRRALRPGGQIVIIDFQKKESPGAPMEMRIAREDVVKEFQQAGFRLAREEAFLPYQYFLIFTDTKTRAEAPCYDPSITAAAAAARTGRSRHWAARP